MGIALDPGRSIAVASRVSVTKITARRSASAAIVT
jgi:hypothetical protein